MLRRAMVRYGVHRKTKKPALLLDRIYPVAFQHETKIIEYFKSFLNKKSNLPVINWSDPDWGKYFLPRDGGEIPLTKPYCSYMDTQITYLTPLTITDPALVPSLSAIDKEISSLLNAKTNELSTISESISAIVKDIIYNYGKDYAIYFVPSLNSSFQKIYSSITDKNTNINIKNVLKYAIYSFDVIKETHYELSTTNGGYGFRYKTKFGEDNYKLFYNALASLYRQALIVKYKKLLGQTN